MSPYIGKAINEEGVLREKRDHPEYRRLYSKLQIELTAVNAIDIFCTHEAGHLIFFRKAGFTRFEFLGPTMTYNSLMPYEDESQRYNYYIAAVRAPEILNIPRYDDSVLDALARGASAGEVFNEIRQQGRPVPIDKSSDFDGFDDHCRRALRANGLIGYDAKGRWNRARSEVKAYLENSINEAEIHAAIVEVKHGCFGLS
jgi:hypothetical protein